jgi:hypothetical protein
MDRNINTNIALVDNLLKGKLPPVEVRVERKGLIEIMIALILVAFVTKMIWSKKS